MICRMQLDSNWREPLIMADVTFGSDYREVVRREIDWDNGRVSCDHVTYGNEWFAGLFV